ncbi:hypothetical protein FRAHR75_260071 [Frankia sp. Hr75.2]|nr:hypothetical protein FRAHR75_260071 [Frankia sp. Hr75.2]
MRTGSAAARTVTARCRRRSPGARRSRDRRSSYDRPEHGYEHVPSLFEGHLDLHTGADRLDVAVDHIGQQVQVGLLGEHHPGHDIGRLVAGHPRTAHHRVRLDRPAARDPPGRDRPGITTGADPRRRMEQPFTHGAPADQELPGGPAAPEIATVVVDHGYGPVLTGHPTATCMRVLHRSALLLVDDVREWAGRYGPAASHAVLAHGDVAGCLRSAGEPEPGEVTAVCAGKSVFEGVLFVVVGGCQVFDAAEYLEVADRAGGLAVADGGPVVPESPRGLDDRLSGFEFEVGADGVDAYHWPPGPCAPFCGHVTARSPEAACAACFMPM